MKKLLAVALAILILGPTLAFAGSSTDAALGLGAFAVMNQILSGTGIFGGLLGGPAVAAPVVVATPPPVIVTPPPVIVAPPPQVIYAPPPPVIYAPQAYYAPARVYRHGYYAPARVYPHRVPAARGWCPPGHMKHGRC
jgi:hypothetical protein